MEAEFCYLVYQQWVYWAEQGQPADSFPWREYTSFMSHNSCWKLCSHWKDAGESTALDFLLIWILADSSSMWCISVCPVPWASQRHVSLFVNSSLSKELVFAFISLVFMLAWSDTQWEVFGWRVLDIFSNKICFTLSKSRSNAQQFMSWVTKIKKENS